MRTHDIDLTRPARLLAAALLAILCLPRPVDADLQSQVDQAIRSPQLVGATVAVSIREASSGQELVAVDGHRQMIPASNMKLFTTGAALHVLGAGFQFRTRLIHDGQRLIVVGDGDPAFADPSLLELMQLGDLSGIDVETFLDLWVNAVRESDLGEIESVVTDDRIFDRQFVHPTWPIDQLNRNYCAQVSGLNFHLNVLHFYPQPGDSSRPDIGKIIPRAPWLAPNNKATCLKGPGETSNAWISRREGSNILTVHGNVRQRYRHPIVVTYHDPGSFFAALLGDRLKTAGIEIGHTGAVDIDAVPSRGNQIGPSISTPISTVVTRTNRDSENLYAEALVKRIGHEITGQPGSWTNGGAVVRHVILERLDDPTLTERIVVADGSGLSRGNRVAASTVTAWLDTFHRDEELGTVFIGSLARAGESGTLSKRFRNSELHGTQVRAKSGYINGVSCLSGYVTGANGQRRSFSVLANNLTPQNIRPAKRLQERIVALIAADLVPAEVTLGSD